MKERVSKSKNFSRPSTSHSLPHVTTRPASSRLLEARGIGRPSTYATILSTIQDREYVVKRSAKFYPTEVGEVVEELLVESFREIFDYEYTARMESHLDRIESGRERWNETLRRFYDHFAPRLAAAQKEMKDLKAEEIPTDEVCDKCGSKMVIRWGKFGRFLACSAYPECKNTREIPKVCILEPNGSRRRGRKSLRKMRPPDGFQARPIRRVHGLLRIPGMSQHKENHQNLRRGRRKSRI